MSVLSVQDVTNAGLQPSYVAAAAGGDSFPNNGRTVVHVKNGSASAITVTIASPQQCSHGFTHALAITVNAGADKLIGPLDPFRFNDNSGNVGITYSSATTVTVAALDM